MAVSRLIIIDTGPLVAYLNAKDTYHEWITDELAHIKSPLLTCEAVISESWFLLRRLSKARAALLECLKRNLIKISFSLEADIENINSLCKRYHDVPMSFADACLVRMSEQHAESVLLTIDSDFHIYRKHSRKVIPTIMPPQH